VSKGSTAIIGAGSWGTALAISWASKGDVVLWARDADLVREMEQARRNERYLPGALLPENIRLTNDLEECASAPRVVFVTPSVGLRATAAQMQAGMGSAAPLVLSCTKGIEHSTGLRMSEVLAEYFPRSPVAALSGPNFANEVAAGLPTATVIGCADADAATRLQQDLGSPRFRIYTSTDITSVELGGALKNVFAIAAGVCEGLSLGENARAALITRSLAELVRVGTAMGGDPQTFYGLSGVGDLVLTCYGEQSRNHTVGLRLGRGEKPAAIAASMNMVAEGVPTARSAFECARRLKVETPIIDQVYGLLYEDKSPRRALEELLQRDPKPERSNQ
jgi:glycerol-3-phosphate dehydrogenase (NAD(P)+)